jgi:hypothetical protein
MNNRSFIMLAATAAIAACSAPAPSASNLGALPLPQSRTMAQHHGRAHSWMLPQALRSDLVYVSNQGDWGNNGVYVYSYPQGKQVGYLQPDTEETYEGVCSDSHGNVWIVGWTTNYQAFYDEYAHGGTQQIGSLISRGVPSGCAVDPSTGNLAIANYMDFEANDHRGDIAIYQKASGNPTDYYDASIAYYYYCAYDDKGNLYADGNTDFINELARNSDTLRHIYFKKKLAPGSLQWNGSSLAIALVGGSKGPARIDRVTVQGSGAQIVGSTALKTYHDEGVYLDTEFWVAGKIVTGVGPGSEGPTRLLYFWPYPKGGKALKTIAAPSGANFYGVAFSAGS